MLLLLVMLFLFGISITVFEKEERLLQQWEVIQTECFMQKLCKTGQCSYEDIWTYMEALNGFYDTYVIRIEEFQRETDIAGNLYYYYVSWEEVQKQLMEREGYVFTKESVLAITVSRNRGEQSTEQKYYDVVVGEN